MLNLHQLVEERLEAPALAWRILAYYWGMSAFGLGPSYQEYMQSDRPELDKAFNDPANEDLNRIAGYERTLTIKERFDRAVNFYHYCFQQGRRTSINPPFDLPPETLTLYEARLRMEAKAPPPDKLIQESNKQLLGDDPRLLELWETGGQEQRDERAQAYNARVLETLQYVRAEIDRYNTVLGDQVTEVGFLAEDATGQRFNVTAELMDEVMPADVQDKKFGECYIQHTVVDNQMILSGIFGAYYKMGHSLEVAMFDEESKSRLSSTYYAILRTWRQLYDISKENQ